MHHIALNKLKKLIEESPAQWSKESIRKNQLKVPFKPLFQQVTEKLFLKIGDYAKHTVISIALKCWPANRLQVR